MSDTLTEVPAHQLGDLSQGDRITANGFDFVVQEVRADTYLLRHIPENNQIAMTEQERETLSDTLAHIRAVQAYLHDVCQQLMSRARKHDDTKLEDPEFSEFARLNSQLSETTYGSERYEALLEELRETALTHHYSEHDHHPEHHEQGINGMTLMAVIEMLCDWKAASERHDDGDIEESIEVNQDRFGYSNELKRIFENTARELWK